MASRNGKSGDGDPGDYDVGYGRPPRHTRWRKGQSGNPEGRPKKPTPDVVTIVDRVLSQKVTLREGDGTRELPADQAVDLAEINKAMQGDQTAFGAVIRRMKKLGIAVPAAIKPKLLGALVVRADVTRPEWEQMLKALRDRQAILAAEMHEQFALRGRDDE